MWHIGWLMTVYKLVKLIHNFPLPTPCHSQSLQEPWLCSCRGQLLLTLAGTLSSWHDDADSPHYSQPFLAGSWSIQTAPEGAVLLPALLCACSSLRSLEHKHVLLMKG